MTVVNKDQLSTYVYK